MLLLMLPVSMRSLIPNELTMSTHKIQTFEQMDLRWTKAQTMESSDLSFLKRYTQLFTPTEFSIRTSAIGRSRF